MNRACEAQAAASRDREKPLGEIRYSVRLGRLAWVIGHREEGRSVTEAQARENAARLTWAILASGRHERKS